MCHGLLKDLEVFFVSKTLFNKEFFLKCTKKNARRYFLLLYLVNTSHPCHSMRYILRTTSIKLMINFIDDLTSSLTIKKKGGVPLIDNGHFIIQVAHLT